MVCMVEVVGPSKYSVHSRVLVCYVQSAATQCLTGMATLVTMIGLTPGQRRLGCCEGQLPRWRMTPLKLSPRSLLLQGRQSSSPSPSPSFSASSCPMNMSTRLPWHTSDIQGSFFPACGKVMLWRRICVAVFAGSTLYSSSEETMRPICHGASQGSQKWKQRLGISFALTIRVVASHNSPAFDAVTIIH